ncbi:MAG TPA: HAMP domain-containing sensor histidine kinase [Vicinamibacterales bacterium]|nr:HAMP domain-containing sensor histidine kinase [Vicinamibacterales bacterium]
MSELRWYRSLYWRVAVGFIAFLALMLAAEAALFLWTSERIAGSMPARSPRRLAVLVASDVGTALSANSSLDLEKYLDEQYGHVFQSFIVIMRDGRVASNHDDIDDDVLDRARADARLLELGRRRFGGRPGGPGPSEPNGLNFPNAGDPNSADGRPGRALRGFRGAEVAPIVVNGLMAGRVAVLPGGPAFGRVLRELGPELALVGGIVLSIGTVLIAFVVFGPTRRRLRQVQDATERLGGGDVSARAPEDGGDEVADVARSFNRMADELMNRARALEASDKARRQLLADVSHELMTPLTAMRGYVETLSMDGVKLDGPTRERYMQIVEEETHRLERIIGDLLDLARLEGGGGSMRQEHVSIPLLFDRVASRHEAELAKRNVRLIRTTAPGAEKVIGDPDRLEQALQNLAANALRHTPAGGEVALSATKAADGLHVLVRDAGPGIPPEHLPLIFDRFYKVDASRKAATGSGLGLSIVKAIVERHGGTISARNEDGAVFEIVLPVRQKSENS